MTMEDLLEGYKVCLIVSSVCATSFPLVWAFSRWWSTLLGRLIMLQGVTIAVAVDLTFFFNIVAPNFNNLMVLFWINAVVFGLIALSTVLLTVTVIRMNYIRKKKGNTDDRARTRAPR